MHAELLDRCRADLGSRARRGPAAVSYYAAAAAAEAVAAAAPDAAETARAALRAADAGGLAELLARVEAAVAAQLPEVVHALLSAGQLPAGTRPAAFAGPTYRQRLVLQVVERLLVHPAAPPVLIEPQPVALGPAAASPEPAAASVARAPAGSPLDPRTGPLLVALAFEQPLAVTHELYPLCTDAYVHSLDAGAAGVLPLGVHTDWLDADCRIQRAIRLDAAADVFIESDLPEPARPDVCLVIACGPAAHAALDLRLERAGIPCGNPAAVAALADDKWDCYRRWRTRGVPTPPTWLLPAEAPREQVRRQAAAAVRAVGAAADWFVQPRRGTEGRGVELVRAADAADGIVAAWTRIAASDDAILRPRVGLLGAPHERGGATRRGAAVDLRVNVCHDGRQHRATSGYVLVAADPDRVVTSVSSGGLTRPVSWLREHGLVRLGAGNTGDSAVAPAGDHAAATASTGSASGGVAPSAAMPTGDNPAATVSDGRAPDGVAASGAAPAAGHAAQAEPLPAAAARVPGTAFALSEALLADAARVAEAAAASLPPLSLAGVDVKFDAGDAGVTCCVLDLNPRPAGLLFADLLADGAAGVGQELWRGLERLAAAPRQAAAPDHTP